MKVKYFAALLIMAIIFLGFSKSSVLADCGTPIVDKVARTVQVCSGKYASKEALRAASGSVACVTNSNGGMCRVSGLEAKAPEAFSLSNTPDDKIAVDPNGLFYTCPIIVGVDRAVGSLKVTFSGGGNPTCTTATVNTTPPDWNPLGEGMVWNTGSNTPPAGATVKCNSGKGVNTAIGCISTEYASGGFLQSILGVAIGLGGGIALILMLYGTFIVMTSAGIPDKLSQGKEIITSAAVGLVFIILSIVLMNLIGVSILGIPGL